ncbi:hypothetical protein Tco_1221654 [Tanacetum coccineum]
MKNSIDEPPEVELKDLPPHLEYAFLEGDNKLPVIIAKDLSIGEKAALIKVLQSHKRAIAWKLSDIKGPLPTAALPLASAMQQEHSEIMMAIFKNDQKNDWKCFWMTFRVFGSSFYNAYLLEKMLKRVFVTTTNLARNWEKAISWLRKALFLYINLQVRVIEVIELDCVYRKLHHLTTVKGPWAKSLPLGRIKLDDANFGLSHAIKNPSGVLIQASVRKACHLPIETQSTKLPTGLNLPTLIIKNRGDHRKVQLNELNELRDHAYENSLIYKVKNQDES